LPIYRRKAKERDEGRKRGPEGQDIQPQFSLIDGIRSP
jgi:hypothetical protein